MGVHTAEELAKLSDDQIMGIRGIGPGILARIRKALGTHAHNTESGPSPIPAHSSDSEIRGEQAQQAISVLHLSARGYHALRRAGISTVDQLVVLSDAQLLAIRSIGVATMADIRSKLGYSSHTPSLRDEGTPCPETQAVPLSPNLVYDEAPLAVLDLEGRYARTLKRQGGVATVGELARWTRQELQAIRWVGTGMVTAVERALAAWEELPSAEKQRRVLLQAATTLADTADSNTSHRSQMARPLPDTLGALVNQWLQGLPERARDIVCARFGIGCTVETLQEIAQRVGLTRERVRQIQARSMRRMAAGRRKEELRRFVLGVERLVEQMEGLVSAEELQRELPLAVPLGDGLDAVVAAQLLSEASDNLVWLRGEGALALANVPYRHIPDIRRELRKIATSEPDGLLADDVIARYLNAHLFDAQPSAPDAFVRACLRTDTDMKRANGRVHSDRGRGGSHQERIRAALSALGKPRHYGEICAKVNARSPEDQQMTERSVYSCLQLYSDTFVRVGRGVYGLVEWGLPDDGSVANAVCRVLAEAGRPLAKEEITQRVLATWSVSEMTVQAALYTDNRIVHLRRGLWGLKG